MSSENVRGTNKYLVHSQAASVKLNYNKYTCDSNAYHRLLYGPNANPYSKQNPNLKIFSQLLGTYLYRASPNPVGGTKTCTSCKSELFQ